MHPPVWMSGPPQRLLLATDLSARCDRALDRAAQLADEWKAELVVLNVLEAPQAPDLALAWAFDDDDESHLRIAREQLQQDLGTLDVPSSMHIVRGVPEEAILNVARQTACDLIVTGMARNETFGRFLPGNTVETLARKAEQPLLVVRDRPRAAYRRIVVATDFSAPARHVLETAVRFFPGRELTLYHASAAAKSSEPEQALQIDAANRAAAETECDRFLAACNLPEGARERIRVVIENGALEMALTRYVRKQHVDLAVVGTQGRSALLDLLIGSTAARLLDWLPCDTIVIRTPASET